MWPTPPVRIFGIWPAVSSRGCARPTPALLLLWCTLAAAVRLQRPPVASSNQRPTVSRRRNRHARVGRVVLAAQERSLAGDRLEPRVDPRSPRLLRREGAGKGK
ncbi:unnamed protein product [Ectocarpus sp. CCAP 1310/34]|nr:unnamed protein product [Ectocarpus sp. CCAP 1310/34]